MYEVMIKNQGDPRFRATSRGYDFMLGPHGANPGDTLLAALCTCMALNVRKYFAEQKIPSNGFTIDAEAHSTPDESRLGRINVWIDVGDTELCDERKIGLLAFAANCKINNTLKAACPVSVALGRRERKVDATPEKLSTCG